MPVVTFHNEHRAVDAETGANLRQVMLRAGVSPYRGFDAVFNCHGNNFCGTCAVELVDGKGGGARTQEEESTLRGNLVVARMVEKNFRLSCQTTIAGDMTVKTFPVRPVDRSVTKERLSLLGLATFFAVVILAILGYLFLDMIKKF